MERELSNSINMIRTTQTFLTNNAAATAGIAAFAPAKSAVDDKLVLLDALNQIAGVTSKGVTTDTNTIRGAMSNISFKVGSAVSAYAASINNNTLRTKVTYSQTAYGRFKKDEVDDICQTVHDEADTNIAAAGAFGYVANDVTDLQTAIDLYRISAQNPRQAIISKGQAITQMKSIVRDIIDNYYEKQMDKMVDTLLLTNANFHKGYRLSRETINIGVTHAKVRGAVKDVGDVPLIGAAFIIKTTGTNDIIAQTLTKAKGAFSISKIPAGDYDFSWSLAGYQTVTETNVHISAGKELQRKITLQATAGGGGGGGPVDPPGFQITVLQIPAGGSVIAPFGGPGTPPNFQVYMLCLNGTCMVCSTDLPANPCVAGFQLLMGMPFLGTVTALGLDLTKTNIQFTNTAGNDITVRVGIPI